MSINDYVLEKRIGNGTFGDVYRGLEKHSGMKVAIKRIKKKILYENGKYLLNAFYREIEIMKKCECENSIKFIKEFQTQTNYNIIMELCDTDLLCHLYARPNPFSEEEIKECFIQLNNAFKIMNKNNIIHRDLKLGNILIKFTDQSKTKFIPKLSDYGFSKELNSYNSSQYTHLGTPATMAPEIMMNYPYNNKSDLWSIGVMIYQLYYRQVPYEGNTETEVLKNIQSNVPFKQPEDPKLRDLINRLLVINVNKRINWNEYFNHPFFTGEELNNMNEDENSNNLNNSFSYTPFDKNDSSAKELEYSFKSGTFDNDFLVQGDIYSNTDIKSTKNLINIYSFLNDNDNFDSKIKLLDRGRGINNDEYEVIIKACIESKYNNLYQLSDYCLKKIKKKLNGEWFVFVSTEKEDNYDFYLSFIKDEKYLNFIYKDNQFQVCHL